MEHTSVLDFLSYVFSSSAPDLPALMEFMSQNKTRVRELNVEFKKKLESIQK